MNTWVPTFTEPVSQENLSESSDGTDVMEEGEFRQVLESSGEKSSRIIGEGIGSFSEDKESVLITKVGLRELGNFQDGTGINGQQMEMEQEPTAGN
ncbi:hypothetical protein L1987_13931 [Smallanthus sonchifolius]|uniref:Uncharacterized protein n=1 Tax=Smallanthus sonchifolius TaxID=185202 RepID=A0ACB9JK00_9ASTR|nr:hypothetical protein L1987_13931 [Smallanthus sonchifolius]